MSELFTTCDFVVGTMGARVGCFGFGSPESGGGKDECFGYDRVEDRICF